MVIALNRSEMMPGATSLIAALSGMMAVLEIVP